MAINLYNIKKWTRMLVGKSLFHVNQDLGKVYSKNEIKGYYNNFTEKVLRDSDDTLVPKTEMKEKEFVYFPTAIMQFGLGAYDLYLMEKDEKYLEKFDACVNWAMENQQDDGAWNNFFFYFPDNPYGAMVQGEGVSLLLRAYINYGDEKYFKAAKKALDYMIAPLEDGGTTKYDGDDVYFMEFTHKPLVLNGWIFALFGLIDYLKVDDDKSLVDIYNKTVNTLKKSLPDFDMGYWSMYREDGLTCSPFYHNLHISLLEALYNLTEIEEFKIYKDKWKSYTENRFYKAKAFVKKSIEKIKEREIK